MLNIEPGPRRLRAQHAAMSDKDLATLVLAALAALTDPNTSDAIALELGMDPAELTQWTERTLLGGDQADLISTSAELTLRFPADRPSSPMPPSPAPTAVATKVTKVLSATVGGVDEAAQLERAQALMEAWQWGRETPPDSWDRELGKLRDRFGPNDTEARAEFEHGHRNRTQLTYVA